MTSPSPLDRLAGPGNVLGKEAPDAKEFDGLVHSGLARLRDAENEANSLESRFDLAYGAAHALCLAALRHHGFRPSKRYIVFQVLPDTLGLGPGVWRVLWKCQDMRNRTEYEGALNVDDRLVSDLISSEPSSNEESDSVSTALVDELVHIRGRVPYGTTGPQEARSLANDSRTATWAPSAPPSGALSRLQ